MKTVHNSFLFSSACATILLGLCLLQPGCAPDPSDAQITKGSTCTSAASVAADSVPISTQVQHVFTVVLENHPYDEIIGKTQDMPYLNTLATQYAYAKGYFANTHPSIGNYFMLTAGRVIVNHDSYTQTITDDNIARSLMRAGKTWKEYSENLPSVGYVGGDAPGYTEHHNPLSYFSDVRDSSAEVRNLVPFSQLASDLANHTLPNYAFIVPSPTDDAHDCPNGGTGCTTHDKLARADAWLQTNIDPLIRSSDFNTPGQGLLIITFDESYESDLVKGGGHTAWVVVGPDVKQRYSSTTCYQHQSTLRFTSELLGLADFPGAAETAPNMGEFLASK